MQSDGIFKKGLQKGKYYVEVRLGPSFKTEGPPVPILINITENTGDTLDIGDIKLLSANILGSIIDPDGNPIKDTYSNTGSVYINIRSVDGKSKAPGNIDPQRDGSFSIYLEKGKYIFWARTSDSNPFTDGKTTVEVSDSSVVQNIAIKLTKPAVSGKIDGIEKFVDSSYVSPHGYYIGIWSYIYLYNSDNKLQLEDRADVYGNFKISGLIPHGKYTIVVRVNDFNLRDFNVVAVGKLVIDYNGNTTDNARIKLVANKIKENTKKSLNKAFKIPSGLLLKTVEGDVNGDGVKEIVSVVPQSPYDLKIFKQDGTVLAGTSINYTKGGKYGNGILLELGDVDGDGTNEIIVGGNSVINIFKLVNRRIILYKMNPLSSYMSLLKMGINALKIGDIDGIKGDEIIALTTKNKKTNIVYVFKKSGIVTLLFKVDNYNGSGNNAGLDIDIKDANSDGKEDVIIKPQVGQLPMIQIWSYNGHEFEKISNFLAYNKKNKKGVEVAVANVDGDKDIEIITSSRDSSNPQVKIFSWKGKLESSFFPYGKDTGFKSGSIGQNMLTYSINNDKVPEIIIIPSYLSMESITAFSNSGNPLKYYTQFNAKTWRAVRRHLGDWFFDAKK
ncbi:MAG: outer membrane autotransporter barrel protein [uncultured bacterium]|nr:MAG: outer membrane autotransporter barrel protein [uncultured bacterium]